MRRQKWGVIGLAAMLGIAALGCGEKKTEQDNGMDNPATVINWQEETKDAPDAVQGQETLPPELQKLEKWELSDLYEQGALSEAESVRNSNLLNEGRFVFDENGQIYFSLPDTSVIYTSGKKGDNLHVFKDNPGWYASSAAIYGARAANGLVYAVYGRMALLQCRERKSAPG